MQARVVAGWITAEELAKTSEADRFRRQSGLKDMSRACLPLLITQISTEDPGRSPGPSGCARSRGKLRRPTI